MGVRERQPQPAAGHVEPAVTHHQLAYEQSDEEIALEDLGSENLIALPAGTWRTSPSHAEQLLRLAEGGGFAWLTTRGLEWSLGYPATTEARMIAAGVMWVPVGGFSAGRRPRSRPAGGVPIKS